MMRQRLSAMSVALMAAAGIACKQDRTGVTGVKPAEAATAAAQTPSAADPKVTPQAQVPDAARVLTDAFANAAAAIRPSVVRIDVEGERQQQRLTRGPGPGVPPDLQDLLHGKKRGGGIDMEAPDSPVRRSALQELVAALMPGGIILGVEPLAPDAASQGATAKAAGYGIPLRVFVDRDGQKETLVFRTANADEFGHDRRSDRAASMLLDYDTFGRIPRHVRALDIGAIRQDGRLVSLSDCGEFYLVTPYVRGSPYAEDLRRVGRGGEQKLDEERCAALARYLVELHADRRHDPVAYRRSIRDLLGHGEGIFGIIDAYPPSTPGASPGRLRDLERLCLEWRWRLRDRFGRLATIHGDYHPFNVVFQEGTEPALLDTSRGSQGDPADDVTCMAINYLFFALDASRTGRRTLGRLWHRFWSVYLDGTRDRELPEVAPPFLAWRGLVLASPRFYPGLSGDARDVILRFAERALASERFEPGSADELFR